jgi:uncharacterized protein (DUF1778 family)
VSTEPEERNETITLHLSSDELQELSRASLTAKQELHEFVLGYALSAARAVERGELIFWSERDRLRVLELLDNPPPLSERMRAVIRRETQIT